MEDPWGASPWTTPTPAADNDRGPEPPPRAFLNSTASGAIPGLEFTSPWGGDNDDASWASSSLNVWGGDTNNARNRSRENSVAGSRPRSRDNSIGSNRAWPASPGVKTLSRSSSNSILKLPGSHLDPWASEASLELPPSPPKAAFSAGVATRFELRDTIPEASPDPDEFKELELGPQWEDVAAHEASHDTRSRASSSSEDSHERPQDSPITSIDEDSRPKHALAPQPLQRKVSAKVSDLAKMFDSAAKSTSPATSIHRPIPSTRKNFKELVEVARVSSTSTATTVATSIPRPPPSTRASFQTLVEVHTSTQADTPVTSVPRPPPPTRANFQGLVDKFGSVQYQQELTDKYGDVQFTADLEAVDVLFEKLGLDKDGPTADPEEADVSDRIITDSFSSISERRAWYRVSRLGTKRLHDSGGDEYYRRVAWPTSKIRTDTLQTVRRWMEEDSFAGRPHLGSGFSSGANKGKGNLFGWDSSTPDEPVNLNDVFKRRSAPPAPKVDSPVAGFGWSANTFSWSSSLKGALQPPQQVTRPLSMPLKPPGFAAPATEDDEWGEMVTSPKASDSSATPLSQPVPVVTISTQATAHDPGAWTPTVDEDPWGLSFFGPPDPPASSPSPAADPKPKKAVAFAETHDVTEVDQEVRRVVQNLPDLSYMLR